MGCNLSAPKKAAADAATSARALVENTMTSIENKVTEAAEAASAAAAAGVGSIMIKSQGTLNLGSPIPNYECDTTMGKLWLHDYFGSGWGVLFSHPADFTPVCTTELNLVLQYLPEFTKRNCKVIALSCDPVHSHVEWCKDVVAFSDKTKETEMTYPIIADPAREIATKLGMLDAVSKDAQGLPNTCRAVFIVGPEKTLKLSVLYPATTGRNFDELIRVIDSLQLTAQRRLATPADWEQGQECIISTAVSQEDGPKLFPAGVRVVDLPSKKPYLRFTPDPSGSPLPEAQPAAAQPVVTPQGGLNLGDELPNFEADTTQGKIRFHEFIGTSYVVLFSHPADFTPVCTTELSAAAKLEGEFRSRNCKPIALSCDPVESHLSWTQDVLAYGKSEKSQLPFPIIADPSREVATRLGMLDPVSKDAKGLPNTCRAVFIVGPDRKLKLSLLYPATTGRNFKEVIRAIDSLQLTAQKRLATPANWQVGQECVVSTAVSTEEAYKLFPAGVRIVDLPSKKPYLRLTPFVGLDAPAPKVESADDWARSDDQLKTDAAFKELHARYSRPCSDESLAKAVRALEAVKHTVKVFETSKEALAFLASLLKDQMSVSNSGSTTLEQIGWIEHLKSQDSRINNFKGKAAKAAQSGDMAENARLLAQGATADLYVSGVAAIAETGEIVGADLTGTRVGGWMGAKHVVLVAGTNKIVREAGEAKKRLHEYQLKLESARVRVAYKVPASAIVNEMVLTAANPMGPRSTVVLVKESLGF